jgi:hypothetical protein
LLLCLITVKDWAKPLSDHVDPYHLGIRFVGFLTANLVLRSAEVFIVCCEELLPAGIFKTTVLDLLCSSAGVVLIDLNFGFPFQFDPRVVLTELG